MESFLAALILVVMVPVPIAWMVFLVKPERPRRCACGRPRQQGDELCPACIDRGMSEAMQAP